MKVTKIFAFFVLVGASVAHASSLAAGGPVSKVFAMLADIKAKVINEGTEAQKVYDEFSEWCKDRSRSLGLEIKTGKAAEADLAAAMEKETSKTAAFNTKIEQLSGSISANQADMKEASSIRTTESDNFSAEEKESLEVIGTLQRAVGVLSREMAKGGASMLQLKGIKDITQAMDAMVNASVLSSADASRLTSLFQNSQASQDNEGDETVGAPDATVYEGHSDTVVSTLESLLEKAEEQLDKARKEETTNSHNFEMLKQSLTDEIAASEKDMDETKKNLAISEETKSIAEGDMSVTVADLKEDTNTLETAHQDCTTGAEDFQAETKSRAEELKALAQARKALAEALPAAAQTYGAALDQASFLQVSESKQASQADQAKFDAVRLIRNLARKENSVALAQLASRMTSVIRFGSTAGTDPFSKVKSLLSDMITKLQKDAQADASHKGFCDKEISETKSKQGEKSYEIGKLATSVDAGNAKSAKLKEAVAALQGELRDLASAQAQMDQIRSAENALYKKNKAEMEAGIAGVQKALSILRDYYSQESKAHGAAGDAGNGIISMIEIVESDLMKGSSEMEVAESTASMEYEKTAYVNKAAKTSKTKDLEYKGKEAAGLDKSVAESGSDRDGAQAELDALQEYLAKLGKMCIAKAEPYAARKERRQAEIAGLRQALAMLEGEAVLIQQSAKRAFRGKRSYA